MEGLEGEGRVPDPRVAVVPVPLPAGRLGERGRERRHRRAGRHVGQALDRQRRPLHRVAQAVIRDPRLAQPAAPEARRRVDPRRCLVEALRRGEPLGPRQGAVRPVARFELVASADRVALDVDREIGDEPEGHAGPCRVGGVLPVDHRPGRRRPAVVEGGLADQVDLDPSVEALDRAHEHVVAVVVGGRPGVRRHGVLVIPRAERQRVAHDDPARRRLPGRLEDVRPRHVGPRGRVRDAERGEAEEPGLAVEEAAEDARRVEARNAEPVDRAVRGDERARMAVGQERVVRDRRERRRRGGALRSAVGLLRRDGGHRRLLSLVPSSRSRARASGRSPRRAGRPPPGPTTPARTHAREAARRAAAA